MELGDVEPFVRIDPRDLQPIHWGAGRHIDDSDVIEAPDCDGPGPEPRDDDVAARGRIGPVRGDGGSERRCSAQRDAGDVDRIGYRAVKEVGALLVARIVESTDADVDPLGRLRRRDLVDREAGLRDRFNVAAVLDLRGTSSRQIAAGHKINLERFAGINALVIHTETLRTHIGGTAVQTNNQELVGRAGGRID